MNEGVIALFIPITALLIPIVVIYTKHQQRMAELIYGNPQNQQQGQNNAQAQGTEMQNLRQDLTRLQNVVSTLAINVENLNQDRINTSE